MVRAQTRFVQWPHHTALAAALLAALAVLILLGPARKRLRTAWQLRARRGELSPHVATLHYVKMLQLLERSGLRKSAAQTPLEFATSIGPTEIATPVAQLTSLYQSARFGNQGAQIEQMSPPLRSIRDAMRSVRRAPN